MSSSGFGFFGPCIALSPLRSTNLDRIGLVPETGLRGVTKEAALTPEIFIEAFRTRHGWRCKPGSRIAQDLTEFAIEHAGSTQDVDELYSIFCLSNGLAPYPVRDGRGRREE